MAPRRNTPEAGLSSPQDVQDGAARRAIQELQESVTQLRMALASREADAPAVVQTVAEEPVRFEAGRNMRVTKRGNAWVFDAVLGTTVGESLFVLHLPEVPEVGDPPRMVFWLSPDQDEDADGDGQWWMGSPGAPRWIAMGGMFTNKTGEPTV